MRILLESIKKDEDNQRNFFFENPLSIISCIKLSEIKACFNKMEEALNKGFYLAGFLSYEAGYAFEEKLWQDKTFSFPLLYFGIYDPPKPRPRPNPPPLPPPSPFSLKSLIPNINYKDYTRNINTIKEFIACGDTYQVNYTFRYNFKFEGSPSQLYEHLKTKQSTSYSALIETPEFSIISLSPELFFRKIKEKIEVKPMKGTSSKDKREELRSLKNRAENLMIVDLLRNDLGRISETGSVNTQKLFEIEEYESLLQMTSIIKSKLRNDLKLFDLFSAIYPSGSVTGAPKIRTMQIIRDLEKEERKIYTGSIGFISPDHDAVFNVSIRTLLIQGSRGEMGVGGGITYDSDPEKEYEECKLKAGFLLNEID